MPVVFVHGVATRRDPDYERGVTARDALFKRYVQPALGLADIAEPLNAYWGGDAAEFRWSHASLPRGDEEAFGAADQPEDGLLAELSAGELVDPHRPVSSLASRSLEDAVDLVWASAGLNAVSTDEAAALAAVAYQTTARLPELRMDPSLTKATDDVTWLNALADRLEASRDTESEPAVEAFGPIEVWDRLRESLIRLEGAGARLAGQAAAKLLRARLHRQAALFLGDVLTYINERGTRSAPGKIVSDVARTLDAAVVDGPPLIVVAHSMGGNIVYDVLSYYRPDIHVDAFVTVGSQVGLFEELCLLQAGKEAGCPKIDRVGAMANVTHWLNVFDHNDMLGFAVGRIFAGVEDFGYSTGRGLLAAHSSYFTMPSFFRRLADRVKV